MLSEAISESSPNAVKAHTKYKESIMKRLLIPLIAASVAIGGAGSVVAEYTQSKGNVAGMGSFSIFIDGKTKDIGLWQCNNPEWVIKNKGIFDSHHPPAYGRSIGRGNLYFPPNSSIEAFRNISLDFVTGILFEFERTRKRNSKLAIKSDELRKDGTYVAVIEQTLLGYHP